MFCSSSSVSYANVLGRPLAGRRTNPSSPSSSKRTNATFGGCALSDGQEEVEINPLDAEMRGISDGDKLRVHNERGETLLIARITDAVLPGVLYTPKGLSLIHI